LSNKSADTPLRAGTGARIASMDQFRGFAIFMMIFVNHAGDFDSMPWMLHHHREGMSINDIVAPIFLFVVGMGFRLSFLRRVKKDNLAHARWAAAGRYIFLTILGAAIYQGYWWDALTDIGLGGLLAVWAMHRKPPVRVGAACAYLALFQAIFSLTGYGAWVMEHSLNGGPLGPLSWAFPLLMGSLAYDFLATKNLRRITQSFLAWGLILSATGWLLTLRWPGIKAAWPFTAYGMSAPYPLYATGLCFFLLLGFVHLCDRFHLHIPHLSVLGLNPLVLYVTQLVVIEVSHFFIPHTASIAVVLLTFIPLYLAHYLLAWFLQRKRIIIKI